MAWGQAISLLVERPYLFSQEQEILDILGSEIRKVCLIFAETTLYEDEWERGSEDPEAGSPITAPNMGRAPRRSYPPENHQWVSRAFGCHS